MLVPAMTLEEIRKEIDKDYPILYRKLFYIMHDMERSLRNNIKKEGFVSFSEYYSKFKNHWIYRLYITKKISEFKAMLVYFNNKGLAALSVTDDQKIIFHTGHFFKRYNERLQLGLNTPNEIIRVYLNDNDPLHFEKLDEIAPGIFKIFCVIPSGIILGMYNKNLMLIKANTFIPNNMLSKTQNELKNHMNEVLEKYKFTSGFLG